MHALKRSKHMVVEVLSGFGIESLLTQATEACMDLAEHERLYAQGNELKAFEWDQAAAVLHTARETYDVFMRKIADAVQRGDDLKNGGGEGRTDAPASTAESAIVGSSTG